MTQQLNDLKNKELYDLGYRGTFNDKESAWLSDQGCDIGQLMDRWSCYLKAQGYTGASNDMLWDYLGDKGCLQDTLMDRLMCSVGDDSFYISPYSKYLLLVGLLSDGTNYGFQGAQGGIIPSTMCRRDITYLGSFGENWMRLDIPQIDTATEVTMLMLGESAVLSWDGTKYSGAWPVSIWDALSPHLGDTVDVTLAVVGGCPPVFNVVYGPYNIIHSIDNVVHSQ